MPVDSFSSAHLAFDVLQVWSSLLKEVQAVNIGEPGVLRTAAPLHLCPLYSCICLPAGQTAREGSGVVVSLGTEILKAPQQGILSALPCMAVSRSMSACWRSYGALTPNCSVVQPREERYRAPFVRSAIL